MISSMSSEISDGRVMTLLKKLEISDKLRVILPDQEDNRQRSPVLIMLATAGCLTVTGLLVASLTIDRLEDFKVWDLEAWRWCGFILTLVAGGLATGLIMDLAINSLEIGKKRFGKHIENLKQKFHDPNGGGDCVVDMGNEEFKDKEYRTLRFKEWALEEWKRVAHVVSESRGSIQAFIWVFFILIAWILLFRNGVNLSEFRNEKLNKVTRGLAATLVAVALWMVKSIALQRLGYSFIVERSESKIKEAEEEQEKLRDLWKILQVVSNEKIPKTHEGNKTKVLKEELGLIETVRRWTPKRMIWRFVERELPLIIEDENQIDTVERAARVTGEWLFEEIAKAFGQPAAHKSQTNKYIFVQPTLLTEQQPRLLEKLEKVTPQVKFINKVQRFRRTDMEDLWFRRKDMEDFVAAVYIDRVVLLRTINGRDNVLCELNRIISLITLVAVLVVWLLVMGLLTSELMIVIAGQILAYSFMFSNTAKTVFEAIFFVFVTRPFDVGDRCRVGSDDDEMVVHDMNILSTIFKKCDGEKVYYPNSVLMDKNIINFHTVPGTSETIGFTVPAYTFKDGRTTTIPQVAGVVLARTTIQKLQDKINKYLAMESKKWQPECSVVIDDGMYKDRKIQIVILTVKHKVNFYNGGDQRKHRDELISELLQILEKLKIVMYPKLCEPEVLCNLPTSSYVPGGSTN